MKNLMKLHNRASFISTSFAVAKLKTFGKKRLHVQGSESKFDVAYITNTIPGEHNVQKFWFQHFQVLQL